MDVSKAELVEDLEEINDVVRIHQYSVVVLTIIAFFINCIFLVVLDHGNESRRSKSVFAADSFLQALQLYYTEMSTTDNADDYDDLEFAARIIHITMMGVIFIAFFFNCSFLVILDYGKEPRRIKNIFASHTLGRILIAATLASDYGRQIVIGERLSQTKPIECILRSPELILLVFSSTYSAFAQLMLSICILIPALRPKTPYLIREHITDQMFLFSLFMSSINVVGSVISVFFKGDVDISLVCSFDQVLLKPYALFQWTFITVCFHISIAIYVTAFYLTQKQEARRKEINNSQVREVLLRELLLVKHLLPIFVLSVPFELLPHTVRTFIAYGYIDRRFVIFCSFVKCIGLISFPLIYICYTPLRNVIYAKVKRKLLFCFQKHQQKNDTHFNNEITIHKE
ncbi:hypothetical protein T11_2802 [Trichinella zimbabwensis]|uniref:G-protein coupled receptors family 1 profile domain-containing protein n=1 Tax=Trichinella zimbabwensis TaxID=268475 RepID=A0A0V1HWC7_9BILA|nr:hypothetical protein T11_2802 [Trichinella zimbabwensis]